MPDRRRDLGDLDAASSKAYHLLHLALMIEEEKSEPPAKGDQTFIRMVGWMAMRADVAVGLDGVDKPLTRLIEAGVQIPVPAPTRVLPRLLH